MPIDVKITRVQGTSKFNPMPTGFHQAVIKEVKRLVDKDGNDRDFGFGPKETYAARFINAQGQEASRYYSPSLFEKSKLAIDLKALDGKIPDEYNLNQLVGRQVQILVKNEGGKAKVVDVQAPAAGQNVAA